MAGIVVRPRARILHGHDWVFSSEVLKVFGNPADGDVISIKDGRDRLLGSAIWNSKSQIVARRFSHRRQDLDLDFFKRRIAQAAEYRDRRKVTPQLRRVAGRNSGSIWRSAMGYVNLVPRDPLTPLRFAQDDGYYRVGRSDVSRNFVLPFLCLGRSNCDRGREDKCRQAKLAKASFKNFAPEIGAILGLHPQIIARHGGVSVMTWR